MGSNASCYKYQTEIQSMMFTFGEVRYPLASSLQLVEDILHTQAVEWMIQASEPASLRGSKTIGAEDLIFLVRREPAKVSRLKEFLSWKEVRKNVKTAEPSETFEPGAPEEVAEKGPPKKKWIHFAWEFPSCLGDLCNSDHSEDEEEMEEYLQEVRERLEEADKLTSLMSQEQYMEFAECRQASFTYKKSKKFRDWLGFPDKSKPSDEVLEILGFLLWEGLRGLTVTALACKKELEVQLQGENRPLPEPSKTIREKKEMGLFVAPVEQSPLLPEHIYEAYNRLQTAPCYPLKAFSGGLVRRPVRLI